MRKYPKRTLSFFCAALLALGAMTYPSFAGEETGFSAAEQADSVPDAEKAPEESTAPQSGGSGVKEADSVMEASSTVSAVDGDNGPAIGRKGLIRRAPAAAANTVASPGKGEHLSEDLGIPVGENGLPTKGLLVQIHTDESDTKADPGNARLMVRFNPCGLKAHNSQPDSYNDGALCVAEYLFKKSGSTYVPFVPDSAGLDQTTGRMAANTSGNTAYRIRTIESYGDTSDLWHAFALTPGEADVAAFVPLGIDGDYYTGEASRYCMRYEMALEDEQNWKIDGDRKISGGYLVSGAGETEHKGKAQESLQVSLVPKTGGYDIKKQVKVNKDGAVFSGGISLHLNSLPEEGLPGRLMLRLTPPSDNQNGEGGFGFVSSKTYRDAGPQVWKMPIDGKSGFRVLIQRWATMRSKAGESEAGPVRRAAERKWSAKCRRMARPLT